MTVYNIVQGWGVKIGDSVVVAEPFLQRVDVQHQDQVRCPAAAVAAAADDDDDNDDYCKTHIFRVHQIFANFASMIKSRN